MPWVNEEMCIGCGICVAECPVDAIAMQENVARINDPECIRCGHCHDICPQEAVRHDSERIPQEIEANLEWAKTLLKHFDTTEEQRGLIQRLKRHFAKEKKIAEQTSERLDSLVASQ